MANELATRNGSGSLSTLDGEIDPAIIEHLMINGDLKGLSVPQRIAWYQYRCKVAGLNPAARPFGYPTLDGKVVLYAFRAATDQLAFLHKLSVSILSRETDAETSTATARVVFPDGRIHEDIGVVPIKGLLGERLANAMMKTVTKAKRRAILASCGLGDVPDESELETIRDAIPITAEGHAIAPDGSTRPWKPEDQPPTRTDSRPPGGGSPQADQHFREWVEKQCNRAARAFEEEYADAFLAKTGEPMDEDGKDSTYVTSWQLSGHLFKELKLAEKRLNGAASPSNNHRLRALAMEFEENGPVVKEEAARYFRLKKAEKVAELGLIATPETTGEVIDVEPEPETTKTLKPTGNEPASYREMIDRTLAAWESFDPPANDQAILDREEKVVFALGASAFLANLLDSAFSERDDGFEEAESTLIGLFNRNPAFLIAEAKAFVKARKRETTKQS
jgi:hypothetical protein